MKNYFRKLAKVLAIMIGIFSAVSLGILFCYGTSRIGSAISDWDYASDVGAAVGLLFIFAAAIASSDWDGEMDGC